jgi:hypothetical protein
MALPICSQDRPTLAPANSAELQRLPEVQESATIVPFSKRTPPQFRLTHSIDSSCEMKSRWIPRRYITLRSNQESIEYLVSSTVQHVRAAPWQSFTSPCLILHDYESYTGLPQSRGGDATLNYAIAQSAHDALVFLYPSQQERLDSIFQSD